MVIVADFYRIVSIKAGEREIRGRNDRVIIKSTKSKVPKDFQAVLRNGKNKNRLIDLLCDTISSPLDRALVNISHLFFKGRQLCTSECIASNNCG